MFFSLRKFYHSMRARHNRRASLGKRAGDLMHRSLASGFRRHDRQRARLMMHKQPAFFGAPEPVGGDQRRPAYALNAEHTAFAPLQQDCFIAALNCFLAWVAENVAI